MILKDSYGDCNHSIKEQYNVKAVLVVYSCNINTRLVLLVIHHHCMFFYIMMTDKVVSISGSSSSYYIHTFN